MPPWSIDSRHMSGATGGATTCSSWSRDRSREVAYRERESKAGRGGESAVHDRRGARTTTEPKAPEIIMTPAWQLGQRRNICLMTQHENIFQPFPVSSIPVSLSQARHVAPQLAVLGSLPVHANESWIHVRCAFPGRPLLTQCTMRWPRGGCRATTKLQAPN